MSCATRPQKEMPMRTLEQTTDEILNLTATHFKVPRAELAPNDDFFKKLGIDSLQALELLTRLENHFGIELIFQPCQQLERLQAVKDRKSTRLNSSHLVISYAVFC